jgi:hypothetical protein
MHSLSDSYVSRKQMRTVRTDVCRLVAAVTFLKLHNDTALTGEVM